MGITLPWIAAVFRAGWIREEVSSLQKPILEKVNERLLLSRPEGHQIDVLDMP